MLPRSNIHQVVSKLTSTVHGSFSQPISKNPTNSHSVNMSLALKDIRMVFTPSTVTSKLPIVVVVQDKDDPAGGSYRLVA